MKNIDIWTDEDHVTWQAISRNAETFVDSLTGREDIAIIISPDTRDEDEKAVSEIPAGRFYPSYARMNINADLVFPVNMPLYPHVSPEAPYTQRAYPAFVGTLVHESAHAKHTLWNLGDNVDPKTHHWVTLLEEIRCEQRILNEFPQYARYVKVIVQKIVAPNLLEANAGNDILLMDRFNAAQNAILIAGRADYDVFEEDELVSIYNDLDMMLSGQLDELKEIWSDVYDVADDDYEGLAKVAERIADFVDPKDDLNMEDMASNSMPCGAYIPSENNNKPSNDAEGEGSGNSEDSSGSGESEGSNGSGDSEGSNDSEDSDSSEGASNSEDSDDDSNDDNSEGTEGSAGESSDDNSGSDDSAQGNKSEPNPDTDKSTRAVPEDNTYDFSKTLDSLIDQTLQEIHKGFEAKKYILPESQHEQNQKRREEIRSSAKKVKQGTVSTGYGYSWYNNDLKVVNPSQEDISRMRSVTNAIEKAHFRDITRTVTASQLPPGRFVIREAMNRRAQIDNGQAITATPWNQVRRRSVENPPITLGILSDISGSMNAYQREVGSFTWALSNAVQKLHGSVGAIAWSTHNSLYEMIKPNTRISKDLRYYTAGGGSDGLPSALKAADGMLNLSFGEGVRVLAIITDSDLPDAKTIQKEIDYLALKGVVILWVSTSRAGIKPKNVTYAALKNPDDFGRIVGPKIIEALASYVGQ